MIKISVRDIISKGLDVHQSLPKENIGLSDEEIDVRSPLQIDAHLERAGNTVTADTTLKADFGFTCARCLEDMHAQQTLSYHFDFEVTPQVEYIDLGEEIRQEMIMANPAKILCKEDCKGMCPKCGVNLNKEKCKCSASR